MANSIEDCPVPLVLKKILKDRLSGIMHVEAKGVSKRLFFVKGALHFATSNDESERLGNVLFKRGVIDEIILLSLDKFARDNNEKLGRFLINKKFISKAQLFQGLLHQVTSICASAFPLHTGEWEFTAEEPKLATDENFNINMVEMIQKGVYQMEDLTYYINLFAYKTPVKTVIPDKIKQFLSVNEIKFYNKLSQFHHHSNKKILAKMQITKQLYWQFILLFYLLNLVDFIEYRVDKVLNEKIEEINEWHARLSSGQADPFETFGMKRTIGAEEASEYLENISKGLDPETLVSAPNGQIHKKALFVLEAVYKAINMIAGRENRERNSQLKRPEVTANPSGKTTMPERELVRRARKLYVKAHDYYHKKMYHDAVILLQNVIKLDPSRPTYYLLLGLCQTNIPSLKSSAETNLKKAADMEPWNADPIFYLGEWYQSENLTQKAEACFKLAVDINMEKILAGQKIQSDKAAIASKLASLFSK